MDLTEPLIPYALYAHCVELGKLKADGSEDEARLVQLSDKLIQKVTTQVATYLKTKSDKVEEDMEVFGQAFHPSNS